MAAFASQSDVEDYLGRSLSDTEEAKVDSLLERASALVSAYTGQDFSFVEDDEVVLRISGYLLTLPQKPVVSVSSVRPININGSPAAPIVGFRWDGLTTVDIRGWECVINLPEFWKDFYFDTYQVVYTHGYEVVPAAVVGVVSGMAGNALSSGAVGSGAYGVVAETIGNYSYRLGDSTSSGGFSVRMSDDDKTILNRYKNSSLGSVGLRLR